MLSRRRLGLSGVRGQQLKPLMQRQRTRSMPSCTPPPFGWAAVSLITSCKRSLLIDTAKKRSLPPP